jgi:hypothetical protein
MSEGTEPGGWLRNTRMVVATVVVARLVLETAGASHAWTRYLSSTFALSLAAIYLGAIAPLHGVTRFAKLVLPAMLLTIWTAGWVIFAIVVSWLLELHGSHFTDPAEYGNWSRLGQHVRLHAAEIPPYAAVVLLLMAAPFLLRRWPVTVGPAAVVGALVTTRYWVEAMGADPARAAALSSTVAVLLCAFHVGGIAPRFGLSSAGQFFVPSILIGWVWRFWVFLAAVLSALGFYRTHFFDPSRGRIALRLARLLGVGVVEGLVFGLLVWGIAVWISRATRSTVVA